MQTQANFGWMGPDPIDILITNRSTASVAVGAVLQLDRRRADAASTSNQVGVATSGIANGIAIGAATTDQMACETFMVVRQAAADDVKCVARLRGYCDAVSFVAGAGSNNVVLATSRCVAGAATTGVIAFNGTQENTGTAAALIRKVIFLPLTAGTAPSTTDGWFDGVNGFGSVLITSP